MVVWTELFYMYFGRVGKYRYFFVVIPSLTLMGRLYMNFGKSRAIPYFNFVIQMSVLCSLEAEKVWIFDWIIFLLILPGNSTNGEPAVHVKSLTPRELLAQEKAKRTDFLAAKKSKPNEENNMVTLDSPSMPVMSKGMSKQEYAMVR